MNSSLSGNNVYRYVEYLCYFEDGVDVSACRGRHVVCGARLAPSVAELSCSACEACSHVGISERKDRSFFIDAFCDYELKVTVPVLRDAELCHRACFRIELRQISAACLAMEHVYDFHGRLLGS